MPAPDIGVPALLGSQPATFNTTAGMSPATMDWIPSCKKPAICKSTVPLHVGPAGQLNTGTVTTESLRLMLDASLIKGFGLLEPPAIVTGGPVIVKVSCPCVGPGPFA